MKKYLLLFLVIAVVLVSSCASKRYAKKGLKYEQAGLFEMAAQSYLRSLQANQDNIDARIGLKKNGQRLLDQKILVVQNAYNAGDDKKTVYGYLEAKNYKDQLASLSIELLMSEQTTEMFKDAKPTYLEKIYNEAQLLLDDEKFKQSEELLAEIQRLEPGYGKSEEMMKVSKSEPIYRQGKVFFNTGMYRKSYASFDLIIRTEGNYKDSKELRDEALAKGRVTIFITNFVNNAPVEDLNMMIENKVQSSLISLKNPFIKIIGPNTDNIALDQQRAVALGSDIQVGKRLAAKAILAGTIISFKKSEGNLVKKEKRGYIKEEYTTKDPVSGQAKKDYRYKKVTYTDYTQKNVVTCSFQFQLTSTESSALLVSDAMDINASDDIHYIVFDGNVSNLIPGYWEHIEKSSPNDKINDSSTDADNLRKLIKSNRNIKSIETLESEIYDNIAARVTKKIDSYNPEE